MMSIDVCCFVVLFCFLCLVIGGVLIVLMSLNVQVEDGKIVLFFLLDILLGLLFNDVQSVKLFVDQKIFVDVIFNSDLLMIFVDYWM